MTEDERTIRNYEKLRDLNQRLETLFSELSGEQFYVAANHVSAAARIVSDGRHMRHPEYIEAKNRQAKES